MPNHVPTLATLVQATAVVLLLVSAAPAAAQFPVLYTWPGASPCDGTLQACIDAAGADDSVEIATDGPIDEEILSYGSLDLMAAFGFTPRFAFGRSITANSAGAGDQAIRIQGLTMDGGRIDVNHLLNGGALTAQILDNVVERAPSGDAAIDVYTNGSGPLVFRVEGNEIACGDGGPGGVRVTAASGFASGDIERNAIRRIIDYSGSGGFGIDLYVQDGALVADVFRNIIDFEFSEFGVRARGNGIDVRIVGNAIEWSNLLLTSAAISVFDPATPDGIIDTEIVNNTIHYSMKGIVVEGGSDTLVANNLLAATLNVGLSVDGASGVSNRNNLFFTNTTAIEGTTAGPGSVFANPGLTEDDFLIPPSSPAVDAGDSAALPPEFTTDLYGDPRVQGASVDIGAVEVPEPPAALASGLAIAACASLSARLARRQRSR